MYRCTAFIAAATVMATTAILPLYRTAAAQHVWQQSNAPGYALQQDVVTSEVADKPVLKNRCRGYHHRTSRISM